MNRTQTYELQHPLHQVPSVAVKTGYYQQNGRPVGLELQFCDGHRASLTYDEINKLKRAIRPPADTQKAVITINRQAFDYTMSLVRAGVEVVTNHRVKRDRAMEIIAEHAADDGWPSFDPTRPLDWTWSVEVLADGV
jgi:hypothetical protein